MSGSHNPPAPPHTPNTTKERQDRSEVQETGLGTEGLTLPLSEWIRFDPVLLCSKVRGAVVSRSDILHTYRSDVCSERLDLS